MKLLSTLRQSVAVVAIVLVGPRSSRVYPAAIPLAFLQHFQEDLKLSIARDSICPIDTISWRFRETMAVRCCCAIGRAATHAARDHGDKAIVYDEAGFCNPNGHERAGEPVEIIAVGAQIAMSERSDPGPCCSNLLGGAPTT